MNVLYDSHTFSEQTFGGISRYFVELMRNLPERWDYSLPIYASENDYLKLLLSPPRTISLKNFPEHRKLYYIINGLADKTALKKGHYDVFHPTGFKPYFIGRVKSPVVVTVHDMIYHYGLNPGKHTSEIMADMEATTRAADRIIAISEATKQAIVRFYGIDESRIDVIHHGFNPVILPQPRPGFLPERYILFIGHRGGYKNFEVLLNAFSIISQSDKSLNLVCTGHPFSKAELRRIAELGLSGKCMCRFFPSEDMPSLYANAECFIFPSKMEGFGMPVLEAFSSECPVILSDASCFPEIAGSGGIYFNPDDAEDLATKINETIGDPNFRKEKISAGKQELKRFSWKKTAQKTTETYIKAIRQKNETTNES